MQPAHRKSDPPSFLDLANHCPFSKALPTTLTSGATLAQDKAERAFFFFFQRYSPSPSFQKHSITRWATQVEETEVIFRSRLLQRCLLRRGQRAFLHVGLLSLRCSSNSQLLLHSQVASWPISSETLLGVTSCPLTRIPPKPSVSPSEACCPALLQRGRWKKSI